MLSEMQAVKETREYVSLEAPITMRIRFRKVGDLQYISHLDLQRTIQRILVRADVPVWYTKGFNPHMKIVFSTPLSIGAESICEMLDVRLEGNISCEEMIACLNQQVTDELRILDAYIPNTKFSDIVWSRYEITALSPSLSAASVDSLYELLRGAELLATKKTKSGEKTVNIVPLVRDFVAEFDEGAGTLRMKTLLRADGESYVNPELFLFALHDACGILTGEEHEVQYSIMRTENYFEDGVTVFR